MPRKEVGGIMTAYATPEWLEEVADNYRSDPTNEQMLKRLGHVTFAFRINSEPRYGIDPDLYFMAELEDGVLKELKYITREEGEKTATWLIAGKFNIWRDVIQKELKLTTGIMQGKLKVEAGDQAGIIVKVGPVAHQMATAFTKTEIAWPDRMSEDELAAYVTRIKDFREELGV